MLCVGGSVPDATGAREMAAEPVETAETLAVSGL